MCQLCEFDKWQWSILIFASCVILRARVFTDVVLLDSPYYFRLVAAVVLFLIRGPAVYDFDAPSCAVLAVTGILQQVDHREGLLTPAQLEESWMQCQLSLSGLIQEHMTRLSRPGHFLQVRPGAHATAVW